VQDALLAGRAGGCGGSATATTTTTTATSVGLYGHGQNQQQSTNGSNLTLHNKKLLTDVRASSSPDALGQNQYNVGCHGKALMPGVNHPLAMRRGLHVQRKNRDLSLVRRQADEAKCAFVPRESS
jgi:hypothetical protein